ncbi:hypothetical protein IWX79_002603 [Janthinobacterium sp. CAN_S1]
MAPALVSSIYDLAWLAGALLRKGCCYWLSATLSAKYSVSPKHCVGTPLCWL